MCAGRPLAPAVSRRRPIGQADIPAREWLDGPDVRGVVSCEARRLGLDAQEVPDLAQEVCLALWLAGPKRPISTAWVVQTARHKVIDILRKRTVHREEPLRNLKVLGHGGDRAPERSHYLPCAVCRLRGPLRRFFRLRFEEGLTQLEIGIQLGLPRGAVRWLERCCLRALSGK
jgi:RNA polymerase sigma factor (sigma-70 family)